MRARHQGSHLEPSDGVRAFGARVCGFGAGIGARHRGLCARSCAVFRSTKLCLLAPPLGSGAGSAQRCRVCAPCWGFPQGEMLFFPAGAAGPGGQRGWVCEARQGWARTQPRSVPSMRCLLVPGQGWRLSLLSTGVSGFTWPPWAPVGSLLPLGLGAGGSPKPQSLGRGLGAKRGRCWCSLSSTAGGTGGSSPGLGCAGSCEVLGEGSWERLQREVALGREVLSEHRGAAGLSTPFAKCPSSWRSRARLSPCALSPVGLWPGTARPPAPCSPWPAEPSESRGCGRGACYGAILLLINKLKS